MTAESFTEDGFLKTGDRGALDEEGRLKITGRVKELFKTSKGKYVAPAPIENLLNSDRHIESSCVAGSGQALLTLLERVNAKLEDHERLFFVTVVKDRWSIENGFLTPTMKIRGSHIESAYAPHLAAWYEASRKVIWQQP